MFDLEVVSLLRKWDNDFQIGDWIDLQVQQNVVYGDAFFLSSEPEPENGVDQCFFCSVLTW